ncbi:hypothetical protein DFJ58DRAFT_814207 [Suillus subalutaceus]|uniref:uncharacterized protein n=1 Tax=Suillus subalutaceus TaxID=48586 RepID=UPI001B87F923|nr:uncharacterized protein DFJ58DRAFT_814207 [Suillus subalutaceus]KAG1838375.1 hypothetical protein DFJ58DRAFT_814207 [Suillus subalutaceus]
MHEADPTSQSNYLQIATKHITFDWTVDFDNKVITGTATHEFIAKIDEVSEVIFDTSYLHIERVKVDGDAVQDFRLGPKHEVMGSALHVEITYRTTANGTALQFLAKEQTQGKTFPFLFSQCQPIHARDLAPVQDTPSVKLTYSASVRSVLPVLLSARRISPPSDGPAHDGKIIGKDEVVYTYDQPTPIPSYLLAIAAGNLQYRPFQVPDGKQWKSGVWSEPELMDSSFWEFSRDTARSLTDVVIHELTHSWFGNGVTHAHASHFWLNEGWTTYVERVLLQIIHSPAHRGLSSVIGYKGLLDALAFFEDKPKYQKLVIDFDYGEDPDSAFSRVPYDKGANFLLHIERTLGGLEVFLPYVKDYIATYMGHSITTETWKNHLYAYFQKNGSKEQIKALNSIDWDMEYDLTLANPANALADRWYESRHTTDISKLDFKGSDLDNLDANQRAVFLERLESYNEPLPAGHLFHFDKLYAFSKTLSAEIRFRFYALVLKSQAAMHFVQGAANWVIGADDTGVIKGRMKFCRPVFRVMFKVKPDLAISTFRQAQTQFHPIAQSLIAQDLGLDLAGLRVGG